MERLEYNNCEEIIKAKIQRNIESFKELYGFDRQKAFSELIELGFTITQIAKATGYSYPTIKNDIQKYKERKK